MLITWIDIIVISIAIFSGFISLTRGFSKELLSLITLILCAYISYKFYKPLAIFYHGFIASNTVSKILAVASIFFISFIILSIISSKISDMSLKSVAGPMDRFLGLLYGVTRGLLMASMAVFLISNVIKNDDKKTWLISAHTYPLLYGIGDKIFYSIPENLLNVDKIFGTLKKKTEDN